MLGEGLVEWNWVLSYPLGHGTTAVARLTFCRCGCNSIAFGDINGGGTPGVDWHRDSMAGSLALMDQFMYLSVENLRSRLERTQDLRHAIYGN